MRFLLHTKFSYLTVVLFFVLGTHSAYANSEKEIQYLLDSVLDSNCTFIRNNSSHTPQQAVEHMRKKWNYYEDRVNTAEQFIEYSATKSLLSGSPYYIDCPDQPRLTSKQWLLNKLEQYRQQVAE